MQLQLDAQRNSIPFFDCWIGYWSIYEPAFNAIYKQLEQLNLSLHLSDTHRDSALAEVDRYGSVTQEGIGVISMSGPMMKHASSFGRSCSTVAIRRQIRDMVTDSAIRGIILKIDSPGGTVAGNKELADEITRARESKPVWAYCSDLCASAAYWVASQCQSVGANATAFIGSIGTYCVVADSSAAAGKLGIKVHVVRAGEFKGMGTPGTEITEDHLGELQAQVKGLNTFFLDAVATGRGMEMESVSKLADGRVHLADEAKNLGLIDSVMSFEDFFEECLVSLSGPRDANRSGRAKQESDMSTTTTEPTKTEAPKLVSLADLDREFPKASSDWKLSCLRAGMAIDAANKAYIDVLQADLENEKKSREALEAKLNRPGVKPVKTKLASTDDMEESEEDDEEEGDEPEATSRWNAAVSKELKASSGNRMKAVANANRKNPGLREAMIEEQTALKKLRQKRR